jgi:hypothetical protein
MPYARLDVHMNSDFVIVSSVNFVKKGFRSKKSNPWDPDNGDVEFARKCGLSAKVMMYVTKLPKLKCRS